MLLSPTLAATLLYTKGALWILGSRHLEDSLVVFIMTALAALRIFPSSSLAPRALALELSILVLSVAAEPSEHIVELTTLEPFIQLVILHKVLQLHLSQKSQVWLLATQRKAIETHLLG